MVNRMKKSSHVVFSPSATVPPAMTSMKLSENASERGTKKKTEIGRSKEKEERTMEDKKVSKNGKRYMERVYLSDNMH